MKKAIFLLLINLFFISTKGYSQIIQGGDGKEQTIESLLKRILDIESQLNKLKEKLPFQEMAIMTLIANETNMIAKTDEYGTTYLPRIKIDNPVCNNNPKAVVLAVNQAETGRLQNVNLFFDKTDGYWYLTTPQFRIIGFTPGLHLLGVSSLGEVQGELRETKNMMQSSGVPTVGPQRPNLGEKYSVIIFTELLIPMTKIISEDKPQVNVTVTEVPVAKQPVVKAQILPLTGEWQYKMTSSGGAVFTGKVFLVESGSSISGNFFVTDKTNPKIAGTFMNNILSISRETGLQTTQLCELTRISKSQFSGTYKNQGKYPDSGTIEFFR